jgi:cytochrome c oxidase subunit 2
MPRLTAALGGLLLAGSVTLAACGGDDTGSSSGDLRRGADIYRAYCATCHGADGQGGVGPQLEGRMQTAYPDIEDQILVVANGRANMPAWKARLSAKQIRAVVEYTRTDLGN